nr:uncharacterized protein LOC129393192 isoform X2 [Pan paniscus]
MHVHPAEQGTGKDRKEESVRFKVNSPRGTPQDPRPAPHREPGGLAAGGSLLSPPRGCGSTTRARRAFTRLRPRPARPRRLASEGGLISDDTTMPTVC